VKGGKYVSILLLTRTYIVFVITLSLIMYQLVTSLLHSFKADAVQSCVFSSTYGSVFSSIFLHNTKSPQNGGFKKLYLERILEGLDKFFKSNLCCYTTLLSKCKI